MAEQLPVAGWEEVARDSWWPLLREEKHPGARNGRETCH